MEVRRKKKSQVRGARAKRLNHRTKPSQAAWASMVLVRSQPCSSPIPALLVVAVKRRAVRRLVATVQVRVGTNCLCKSSFSPIWLVRCFT